MKTTLVFVTGMLLTGALILYYSFKQKSSLGPQRTAAEAVTVESTTTGETGGSDVALPSRVRRPSVVPAQSVKEAPLPTSPSLPYQQALNTLISPRSTFAQKQAALQQIKETGSLDSLIAELEKRAAADMATVEYPAALGQAYLQKASTLTDLREQGMLGLKADQSFDAALNIDSSNWDAAFWKVMAMSYWPAELGKGPEVVQRLLDLMKLQESRTPEPQFVQTYILLGEQYQKQGYKDEATQVWQRGAQLFPADPRFAEKIGLMSAAR